MNYFLLFLLFISSSCQTTNIEKVNIAEDRPKQITANNEEPDQYLLEEFVVIRHCYKMIIKSIDSCNKEFGICFGDAHKKSSPYELTYIKIQDNKKVGDEVKYCYVHKKKDHSTVDSYFIYTYDK